MGPSSIITPPKSRATAPPRPPRVGFVLHALHVGGVEVLVVETIRRLKDKIQPTVFCLDAIGELGRQLQAEGVEVLCLQRRPGRDFRVARRMAQLLTARRIDVVHAHQYTPFFYAALARVLAGLRPRLILTEHGRHYPDRVQPLRRAANRLVLDRLANAVNAVCGFSARRLRDVDGFAGRRIEVIENGIELERYSAGENRADCRRRLGLDPERRYLVHVARCHPVKDQATLLRAFREIAQVRSDVDLLFAGDGAVRPDLETSARQLGIEARTQFLGTRSDVPELLKASEVFVLTSLSEAASLTLLEAMAAGLPVVVTAVGGNPEIVRDGREGLLVPRGDFAAVARAILKLLADPGLASRLGTAGAARVRQHYRLERTIDRYFELYRSLCGRARG